MTEIPRIRWKRWLALGAATLVLFGGLFVWRYCPLPSAEWRVTEIRVDGKRVDPLGSTITTRLGSIIFHGCNEITAPAGGLPWRPRFSTTATTAVYCLGPRGELDGIWTRLIGSSVTFQGAWHRTAALRGGAVLMRLSRATSD